MTELDEILSSMDSKIFEREDNYNPLNKDSHVFDYDSNNIVYQEDIDIEFARALIPEYEVDPNCSYQIIHQTDRTVLLKINNNASNNGNPLDKKITEYKLESTDVQSFADMQKSILIPPVNITKTDYSFKESKKIPWWAPMSVILLSLTGIGCCLLYYVISTM